MSSSPGPPPDSGVDQTGQDAASDAGMDVAPLTATIPSLVLVDGLVTGSATSTSKESLPLDDVRVCIHDQSAAANQFITPHAVPYDRAIPLANYPGLQKGSGVDLGPTVGAIDIDVYSAYELRADAAWSPSSDATCAKMSCSLVNTPPCVPHAHFSVTLGGDVNVVALVDDGSGGVTLRTVPFEDNKFNGKEGELWGTVVDLSDWHNGSQIGAFYGNWQSSSDTTKPLASTLQKNVAAPPTSITAAIASYETLGIRFDQQAGESFGQSLDSIAFVANPTVTPPTFYDARENFVFALVGDPNDTTVNNLGGRDPQFNRKGLHVVAVPYATPRPQH